MTALEQLQQASQDFLLADEKAWAAWPAERKYRNLARKVAYGLWLDACRRFRAEGRG